MKLQKNYFKSALVNNKIAEHELNQAKSQKSNQLKENKRKNNDRNWTFSTKAKSHKKMPTYCRHSKFESDVQKNIAQATKSNVRCLSRFIASGVLHNVFGILGGNIET